MSERATKLSKFISFVLRHKPDSIGLTLDAQGWAPIDELIRKSTDAGFSFSRSELLDVVARSDKKRFTLSDDGKTIRAAQGHSIAVELGLESREPPTLLYHGTATRFLDTILIEGLKSQTAFSASATLSSARAPLAAASAVSSTRAAVPAALASVAACLAPLIAAAMGGTTEAAMVATAIALSTLDAFSSASVRAALMTARPGMKASAAATAASLARLAGGCTGQLLSVFYRDAYSALLRQLFWRTRAVRAERQAWLPSERQRRTGRLRTGFRLRVRAQAGCPPR